MSFSPVASGLLTGSITGAAMGFMVAGPAGAIVGGMAGAAMGGMQGVDAEKKVRAQKNAVRDAEAKGIANENAIVERNYKKREGARGLGTAKGGEIASQTGSVLTTPTGSANNLLG